MLSRPIIAMSPGTRNPRSARALSTPSASRSLEQNTAFGVFFLRQFFLQLPQELEESRPALATLALLAFLTNWNDFLWPVYVLFSPESQTLQAGLSTLQSANNVRYDLLMAAWASAARRWSAVAGRRG